jgi:hypothetical protein
MRVGGILWGAGVWEGSLLVQRVRAGHGGRAEQEEAFVVNIIIKIKIY